MSAPGSALPTTHVQRTRWVNVRNDESRLEIPPYACMMIKNRTVSGREATHLAAENVRGEVVWNVGLCTDDAAEMQDPGMFLFNGPRAIARGSGTKPFGLATFDFPAQVLHDGSSDSLPNGEPCGPVADKWYVLRGGGAFLCLSHDPTHAAKSAGAVHTVWVRQGLGDVGAYVYGQGVAGTYDTDKPIALTSIGIGSENNTGVEFESDGWMKVRYSGQWYFHCSATIYGATGVSRGSALQLRLFKRSATSQSETPTPWLATRVHDVEEDQYGNNILTTQENVAFGGFVNLKVGERVRIKNVASKAVVGSICFSFARQFRYWKTSVPSSGGIL